MQRGRTNLLHPETTLRFREWEKFFQSQVRIRRAERRNRSLKVLIHDKLRPPSRTRESNANLPLLLVRQRLGNRTQPSLIGDTDGLVMHSSKTAEPPRRRFRPATQLQHLQPFDFNNDNSFKPAASIGHFPNRTHPGAGRGRLHTRQELI